MKVVRLEVNGRADGLSVVGEQVKNAATGRDHSCVVEGLQVVQDHRLALLVGHRLSGERHRFRSSWCLWAGRAASGAGASSTQRAACTTSLTVSTWAA